MTKIIIIISLVALFFLITTFIFGKMFFKQKNKTTTESKKANFAAEQTKNLKERIVENESFQKSNNTDSFNASIDILHDIATR